jgi:hypothetical protein
MAGSPAVSRFRVARLASAENVSFPEDGIQGTPPTFELGPTNPGGALTTGMWFMLKRSGYQPDLRFDETPAEPVSPGFLVTIWIRDPVTRRWGACETFTADYDQIWVTWDLSPAQIYVQIANILNPGFIDVHWSEQ